MLKSLAKHGGTNMSNTSTHTADCGHTYDPPGAGGGAAGYAIFTGDQWTTPNGVTLHNENTMCYVCADEHARQEMATTDRMSVYVSSDGRTITTWTGGHLGRIISAHRSKGYTPSGGYYERLHVRAETPDGVRWHGQGQGFGMVLNLRRSK